MAISQQNLVKKSRTSLRVVMVDGKKRILTRTVLPSWYDRYAHVLSEDERMYEQPMWDRKRDQKMFAKEFKQLPAQTENDEALARKVATDHDTRIECALAYVDGRNKEANKKLANLQRRRFTFRPDADLKESLSSVSSTHCGLDDFDRKNFHLSENSKWRMIRENKLIVSKLKAMAKEVKRAKIVHRWQKGMSTVRAVLRFWNIVSEMAATTSAILVEVDRIIHAGDSDEKIDNMLFDKNKFNKPLASSRELDRKSMLTLRDQEDLRDDEAITHAAKSLRCLKSFAEFPLRHQLIMARIGQYIEIPADKVIIREGQPPHNFYFLLSGKVVAVKMAGSLIHGEGGGFEVIKGFEQGAMFGEDGLYDCDFRKHSVSSLTPCQIISVNIDDHIRRTSKREPGSTSAEHIKFISKLEMMRKFPLGRLVDEVVVENRYIMFFYFHPGRVITRKSVNSEYVFIVKKGACKVFAEMTNCVNQTEVPIGYRRQSIPDLERTKSRVNSVVVSTQMSELNQHFRKESDSAMLNALIPLDTNENSTNKFSQKPNLKRYRPSSTSNVKTTFLKTCNKTYLQDRKSDSTKLYQSVFTQLPRILTSNTSKQKNTNNSENASTKSSSNHRTVIINTPRRIESDSDYEEERFNTKMWIFLQDLKESDTFGIEDFDLGDDVTATSDLAVVSEGCEMVLISKKFLLEHMSEEMKEHWRQLGKHHPDVEMIVTKLRSDEHWRSYKRKVHASMCKKSR